MVRRSTLLSLPLGIVLLLPASPPAVLSAQPLTMAAVLARAGQALAPLTDPSRVLIGEERCSQTFVRLATGLALPTQVAETLNDAETSTLVEAKATYANWRVVPRSVK